MFCSAEFNRIKRSLILRWNEFYFQTDSYCYQRAKYLYPVQLSIERLQVIADPLAGVPTQLLLHVVEAVRQSVNCLHDEPQLGVLLVSGLERLVPCDERMIREWLLECLLSSVQIVWLTPAVWTGSILRSVTTSKSPFPELFQPRITEMKNKHEIEPYR